MGRAGRVWRGSRTMVRALWMFRANSRKVEISGQIRLVPRNESSNPWKRGAPIATLAAGRAARRFSILRAPRRLLPFHPLQASNY